MKKVTRNGVVVAVLVAVMLLGAAIPVFAQTVHVVKSGENLTQIAARYGTTVNAICRANNISDPNFIWVGQRLVIPGSSGSSSGSSSSRAWNDGTGRGTGGTHVVKPGDNLSSIAWLHGTTVYALSITNGIYYPYVIYPGQVIMIPISGVDTSTPSRAMRATCGYPASIYEPRTYLDYNPGFSSRWGRYIDQPAALRLVIDTSYLGTKYYTVPGCVIWRVNVFYGWDYYLWVEITKAWP